MRRLPAPNELMGVAPRRHVQGPFPEGAPANSNGSNVIDFPGGGSQEPWNWMSWPKGLPTGQENNPNGFDFGLHPQPANSPTPTSAPVEPIYQDPFTNSAAPKFPEGFDPMPGSNQGVQPFDAPGKFGPNDPMIAPMQQTPNAGVIGMMPAIMGAIGQDWAPMDQSGWSSGVPSIPWEGSSGANTQGGQDFGQWGGAPTPYADNSGDSWSDYFGGFGGGGGLNWMQTEMN